MPISVLPDHVTYLWSTYQGTYIEEGPLQLAACKNFNFELGKWHGMKITDAENHQAL